MSTNTQSIPISTPVITFCAPQLLVRQNPKRYYRCLRLECTHCSGQMRKCYNTEFPVITDLLALSFQLYIIAMGLKLGLELNLRQFLVIPPALQPCIYHCLAAVLAYSALFPTSQPGHFITPVYTAVVLQNECRKISLPVLVFVVSGMQAIRLVYINLSVSRTTIRNYVSSTAKMLSAT